MDYVIYNKTNETFLCLTNGKYLFSNNLDNAVSFWEDNAKYLIQEYKKLNPDQKDLIVIEKYKIHTNFH